MNQKVKLVPTQGMPYDEWLSYRKNTIGGSDAATIMNANPYRSAYALFMEKIGLHQPDRQDSEAMAYGRLMEPVIRDAVQYYEGKDPGAWVINKQAGTKYFITKEFPNIIFPWDHPHVAINIDGIIPGRQTVMDKHRKDDGLLEIKTISNHAWLPYDHYGSDEYPWMPRHYKGKYPFYYYPQIQFYMGYLDLEYALLAMLRDNRLYVFDIPFDQTYFNEIRTAVAQFDRDVQTAKRILADTSFTEQEKNDTIEAIAPPVTHHDDISRYFSQKFLQDREYMRTINADPQSIEDCLKYDELLRKEKELETARKTIGNRIRQYMVKCGVVKMILPNDMGYVSVSKNAAMRVNVKRPAPFQDLGEKDPWVL